MKPTRPTSIPLAGQEPDPHKKDVYIKLAGVEERHVQMWSKLLAEHGHTVTHTKPSVNARLRAWFGRRFGTRYLLRCCCAKRAKRSRDTSTSTGNRASLTRSRFAATRQGVRSARRDAGRPHGHEQRAVAQDRIGGFLRNVVYGFNDGLTANFGLVAGVIGASVQPHVIMISGVAGMIADALSMGSSGYLAAKSEQECGSTRSRWRRKRFV